MNDPTDGQSDLDAVLERVSPDKKEAFLRSRLRLKQFDENDEFLAIATYLDNFAVLMNALTKDVVQGQGTNGKQLGGAPGVDHLVHFNEMAAAFERLTSLVQDQQKAMAKLQESDEKIFRKVNLFVEGQPSHQLAQRVWWLGGILVVCILAGMFFLGFHYAETTIQADANARVDTWISLAQNAIANANRYHVQPLPTPGR